MTAVKIIQNSVKAIQDSGMPNFEYGTWIEINEILASMNKNPAKQKQKFPLVFLLSETMRGFDLDPESDIVSGSVDIYIFDVAALNKRSIWREDNEFPPMRIIRDNLIQLIKENGGDIIDINTFDELPYDNTLLNKIEMRVNAIQLGLNIEYELNDC